MKFLKGKELIRTVNEIDYNELEELVNHVLGEEKKKQNEKTIKLYRPNKNTIERFSEASDKIIELIVHFSPYSIQNDQKKVMPELMSKYFNFSQDQIERMDETTKIEIIESAVQGMKKSLRKHRQNLLPFTMMFENDFLEKRLEYLMKYAKEPSVKPEWVYEFLEEKFEVAVRKALLIYFKVKCEYTPTKPSNLMYISEEILFEYRMDCLTGIDDMANYYIEKIQDYLYSNALGFEEFQIFMERYQQFKVKLLTYNFITWQNDEPKVYENKYSKVRLLCKHLESVIELMDIEELELLANSLLIIIHAFRESLNSENTSQYILSMQSKVVRGAEEALNQINKEMSNRGELTK